jgi:proteic killer suppression protein
MIRSFRDGGSEDVFYGRQTKAARQACPESVWRVATRKLDQLDSVVNVAELRIPPSNRLEALKGKRKGQFSIRINDQYRICFVWTEAGPDAVEIVDYH